MNNKYPKSVCSGIPRLRRKKANDTLTTFGEQLFEERRPIKLSLTHHYSLVTVKRSRGGVIKRCTLLGNRISVKSQFILLKNDFLISKRQIVHGACGLVPYDLEGFIVSNEYSVLKTRPSMNIKYLYYLSYTAYFQQTCFHSSAGIHIEKMIFKLHDWFKWKFYLPPLPEQQKIADFLTAVDQRIQLLEHKHKLLKDYKKGVMQQIFAQKIRFKDEQGHAYPDWEEKRLGEVGNITTGNSNRADSSLNDKYTFFDRSEDIRTSSKYLFEGQAIIVAGEGQSFFPKFFDGKFDLHQRTYAIMNFDKVFGKFIYYAIQMKNNYFLSQAVGSTVKSLRMPMFLNMPINTPTLPEQQKIADFLTAIDTNIEHTHNQLEKTKLFKKALLQQMFV